MMANESCSLHNAAHDDLEPLQVHLHIGKCMAQIVVVVSIVHNHGMTIAATTDSQRGTILPSAMVYPLDLVV